MPWGLLQEEILIKMNIEREFPPQNEYLTGARFLDSYESGEDGDMNIKEVKETMQPRAERRVVRENYCLEELMSDAREEVYIDDDDSWDSCHAEPQDLSLWYQ